MQASTLSLLLFSIISVCVIYFLPFTWKQHGLFAANILFYLIFDFRFLLLIIVSILCSYKIGCKISHSKNSRSWLICGITFSLIILAFFKYFNFFADKFHDSFRLIMPLGISYYTFKIISYFFDLHSKKTALKNFLSYGIYVSFFPQIISGPIMRSGEFYANLPFLGRPSSALRIQGFSLILSGLFKKIVIADRISNYTHLIFSSPMSYPSLALLIAAFLFSIQIYCDFSGYSEVSIGISNLLGIKCSPNFCLPYFSYSIKDFWRRWHISLSSWLKDYIYIPLGGSRHGHFLQCLNTLITFSISGLWHGSGLNFLIWGLWHGILNLVPVKKATTRRKYIFQSVSTFLCVTLGWILFNSSTMDMFITYIHHMIADFRLSYHMIVSSILPFTGDFSCLSYFAVLALFILILFIFEIREFKQNSEKTPSLKKNLFFFVSIILFGVFGQNHFLYANF